MIGLKRSILCSLFICSYLNGMEVATAFETTESLREKIAMKRYMIERYSYPQAKKRILSLEKAELENELLRRENKKLKEMLQSKL